MIQLSPQIFETVFATVEIGRYRSLFSLDLQAFIDGFGTNIINFIIVAAFLSYLLYKPVRKMLETRAERIANDLSSAAADKLSAQELKNKYEQQVSEIEKERVSVMDEANKQARERRDQLISEAKADAADLKERANKDIAMEREQIKSAVVDAIVEISTDMAGRFISTNIDKNAHDKLFAEALAELENTSAFTPA
jgi:F-type H+-transporting ATPase subunit b